eukprot:3458857-Rhodomonas_salina.1
MPSQRRAAKPHPATLCRRSANVCGTRGIVDFGFWWGRFSRSQQHPGGLCCPRTRRGRTRAQ